jgi:hypothetical protein
MKRLTFLCILFLGVSTINFAQSEKILKKATELVDKLNTEIEKGDKSLSLSAAQKEKITAIHVERLTELKKLGKAASKDDKKALNKKFFSKVYKEVISKEQLKARKKGKEKKEL